MIKLDHWNWRKRTVIMSISCKNIGDTSKKVDISITVNDVSVNALVDTGSTLSHISDQLRCKEDLQLQDSNCCAGLAVKGHQSQSLGTSKVNLKVKGSAYEGVTFTVLQNLVPDIVLGQDFMNLHESVSIRWFKTNLACKCFTTYPFDNADESF